MTEVPITAIEGIEIGHAENAGAATGCTVVLCREGAVAGVSVRGGSPGTRETDALDPVNLRKSIHAVLLAGGSAFGLDAASGVMRYLEEKGVGRDVAVTRVPIVAGAILFDLKCGDWRIRPDGDMGYAACVDAERRALSRAPHGGDGRDGGQGANPEAAIPEGNVGAGTGAVVGKACGMENAMKGGIGIACFRAGNLLAGAVMAVNCVGDVVDSGTGKILAGALNEDRTDFLDSERFMLDNAAKKTDLFSGREDGMENTIIGTVVTNARVTKAEASRLALIAHNGIARAVRPAHTVFDGDTIFAMATGKVDADQDAIAILAVRAVEAAIRHAVLKADTLAGFPSAKSLSPG